MKLETHVRIIIKKQKDAEKGAQLKNLGKRSSNGNNFPKVSSMLKILTDGSDSALKEDLDCKKLSNIISAQDKVTKYRQKMYDLVNGTNGVKKICPESPKENAKEDHKAKIKDSEKRAKELKEIKKLGC